MLRVAVHVGALLPLMILIWEHFTGGLTANPVQAVQLHTGKTALNLLLLSLTCTPVYIISGFSPVLTLRRTLGMYAFLYATLHVFNFFGIDYSFNLTYIREDALLEKPYILAGLAAFLLLVPLAITSTKGWLRRMGTRNWRILHSLVYVAAILVVTHFIWQTKADIHLPLIYGGALLVLLAIRLPFIKNLIIRHTARLHNLTAGNI